MGNAGRYTNMLLCEVLSMVPLQLNKSLGLFKKRDGENRTFFLVHQFSISL